MGKGKAKPKANAEKTAIHTAKKEAKRAAREASGVKRPHKTAKSHGISVNDLQIKTPPSGAAEALSHVKWPSLFKKHIGVLESHVKHLERVQQSVKDFMLGLPDVERDAWERGEKGHLKIIVGCVERAKETVKNAKEAVSLLPGHNAASAPAPTLPTAPVDEDGDSEMEDASSSSDVDEAADAESTIEPTKANGAVVVEANPYFVVDTEPTPVTVELGASQSHTKKNKSRAKEEHASSETPVDFEALQAKLQAEVDIGEATKDIEAHGEVAESKKDKKRRRSSDGLSKEGKKAKKEEKERKRKASGDGGELVVGRKRKS
ncbi:hypothetical protein GLAREA_06559 [Glarea lozoyensis ATCC 20868]|uniref:Uncharacterized protein n=1 Tax=Glarea lozoyensis (strain ATCC 20868 / MF5171) TaxID=1116229 RepID=S3DN74_GLAL2|nr:uncharacterized protein GLAREA_06559 [Glarea lozoyensis ATCC 20868]EPE33546.1 hypothetical protein GLAREA_06559 [Glarea lozoyensis ATCC 20868]